MRRDEVTRPPCCLTNARASSNVAASVEVGDSEGARRLTRRWYRRPSRTPWSGDGGLETAPASSRLSFRRPTSLLVPFSPRRSGLFPCSCIRFIGRVAAFDSSGGGYCEEVAISIGCGERDEGETRARGRSG